MEGSIIILRGERNYYRVLAFLVRGIILSIYRIDEKYKIILSKGGTIYGRAYVGTMYGSGTVHGRANIRGNRKPHAETGAKTHGDQCGPRGT
jgi:hypothetical protein